MAAELVTPVCEASGLPLPILPSEPLQGALFVNKDYHHHFHPRLAPELSTDISGLAVRYSRGQLVARALHQRYHDFFVGPPLPSTPEEKFRATVLACANVIPRQAIDLSRPGEYRVVTLTEEEFVGISQIGSIYPNHAYKNGREQNMRRGIGKFFASYAMRQYANLDVSGHVIDQFLDENITPERKKELGNLILKDALDVSLESIMPVHRELQSEGYIPESRARGPLEVVQKFFTKRYFDDYHEEMAKRLRHLRAA